MHECSSDICRVTKKIWQVPSYCAVTQGHCTLHATQARVAQGVNGSNNTPGQKTELLNSLTFLSIFFISH